MQGCAGARVTPAARSDESDRGHFTLANQLCVSNTGQAGAAACYLVYLLLAYGHGTPAFAHPRFTLQHLIMALTAFSQTDAGARRGSES